MPLYLADETEIEAAFVVATRLRRLMEGDPLSPDTWKGVAVAMNLRVKEYFRHGVGRGEFGPNPLGAIPGAKGGIVAINTAYPNDEVCLAWVHELAHADLFMWHPPQLGECRDFWRYEGDSDSIHHRIARRVEILIFGERRD